MRAHAVLVDRARHRGSVLLPRFPLPGQPVPATVATDRNHEHTARHRPLGLQGQELPGDPRSPRALLIMRRYRARG